MSEMIDIQLVQLENGDGYNIVLGMAHFIKTVEDVHELIVTSVPDALFGVAFCEASGPRKIRKSGTDEAMVAEAVRMAQLVGAGHSFVVCLKNVYPINILPRLKDIPEVVKIFCATANPVEVIVAETKQGRGILGVVDGGMPTGVESKKETNDRKTFLRDIGYKL